MSEKTVYKVTWKINGKQHSCEVYCMHAAMLAVSSLPPNATDVDVKEVKKK